ncbi:MAG: response regulator [Opitutae bacterium]|nr:response regulator [Opitutae bacterium]
MANLPTLPRRTWLEQLLLGLAVALIVIGGLTLIGWWFRLDGLLQPLTGMAPLKANAGLGILLLGVALLLAELSHKRFSGLALLPALIGAVTLLEHIIGVNLQIDELLARDHLLIDTAHPGRMATVVAGSLLVGGVALAWRSLAGGARARLFAEAVAGSLICSISSSTLLGYLVDLPVVYQWGSGTATSCTGGVALLLLGVALLASAWRENARVESGPPSWVPMPFFIIGLTLTSVLFIGLRDREAAFLRTNTQNATDNLVNAIDREFQQIANDVNDRIALPWSRATGEAPSAVWDSIARPFHDANKDAGCIAISWVDLSMHTRLVYPREGNEGSLAFDHITQKVRNDALLAARAKGRPVISGSIVLPTTQGGRGFVVYAPVLRNGQLTGFVAVEYVYRGVFRVIDRNLDLSTLFRLTITINREPIYGANLGDEPPADEAVYSVKIHGQNFRLSLLPTEAYLQRNRRYLPELMLLSGLGITFLLSLMVHFARGARSGMVAAEDSNRRLLAENEDRRRIEARLKTSDERLRLALDSTGIGIFEWTIASGYVHYSTGLWAMLGYEHNRMPPTVEALQSLIHPEDLPAYRRRIEAQLTGATAFIEPEFRVRARAGDWRWVYLRSKSVAAKADGTPIRVLGTIQDITARREAEEALRTSQAATRKLSLVASRTDNLVIIFTPDGRVEWVNESFTRAMEYSLSEIVGKRPAEFLAGPDTDPRAIGRLRAAFSQGQSVSLDILQYAKSGRKFHLSFEIQPVRNQGSGIENFIAVATDITARVETEQALRRAKAEADAASRAKSEFLASMSHEIRTPMNGVIGMTSLLLETTLQPEQREYVNTIRSSGEALLTIINDILDFSKIESGKMELERLPFELNSCLEETLDLFAVQAAAKQIELVSYLDRNVPAMIVGDVTRLRQVLVNLVNNAVKFTPKGSIALEARLAPGDPAEHGLPPGRMLLEFTVRDTGIGIPADRVSRLFKAFSQVDSSTTRKYGGTGLGLAICQRLCALMGGDICVESTEGQGSSFIFTIQTEAAPPMLDTGLPAVPMLLRGGTVLAIEDHPDNQRRLQDLFATWGASCAVAATAEQAPEILARLPGQPVLLVIDHDGGEIAPALTAFSAIPAPRLLMLPFGTPPPAIPNDGRIYGVVSKPLKTAAFYQTISTLLETIAKATTAKPIERTRTLCDDIPLDVLLVEDNPVNQKVALRFLSRLGYRADAVGNGLEAVNTLETRDYHLVLMDLQMPEMDGLEASRQIRRRLPAARQPKIIALTANALQGDRELCLAAGMDDYISKPVKMQEIEDAIRRQFGPATIIPPSA